MLFPRSVLQTLLALYGFGARPSSRRRHAPPMMIGRAAPPGRA